MPKYFIDQEFQEGFRKPLFGKRSHFIDLISIGMCCEDGRTYYAVSNEFDLKGVWINEWLRENILKPIHSELCRKQSVYAKTYHWQLFAPFTIKSMKTLIKWHGKPNSIIAEEICMFCYPEQAENFKNDQKEFLGRANQYGWNGEQPEFYGYYADYDWVLFCSLFGKMIDLPKGFPMYCRDLKQMLDECYGYQENKYPNERRLESWLKFVENHPDYPKNNGEHNALSDAIWNKELYDFLAKKKFLNQPIPQTAKNTQP